MPNLVQLRPLHTLGVWGVYPGSIDEVEDIRVDDGSEVMKREKGILQMSSVPCGVIPHAGETYLVPELLKTWKREAYRGSEFAPRVLAEHGIDVAIKSDHPVVNSRYLLHETRPSTLLWPGSRTWASLRYVYTCRGHGDGTSDWDAETRYGMMPVYIDAIPQLSLSALHIAKGFTTPPRTPNFDSEKVATSRSSLMFLHDTTTILDHGHRVQALFVAAFHLYSVPHTLIPLAHEGITLVEPRIFKGVLFDISGLDMRGGARLGWRVILKRWDSQRITPRLTCIGETIVRTGSCLVVRICSYHGGVTTAITAPSWTFLQGISTAFTQTAVLRMPFEEGGDEALGGLKRLVVDVESADVMETLLRLKNEYEADFQYKPLLIPLLRALTTQTKSNRQGTFVGASEAHFLVWWNGLGGLEEPRERLEGGAIVTILQAGLSAHNIAACAVELPMIKPWTSRPSTIDDAFKFVDTATRYRFELDPYKANSASASEELLAEFVTMFSACV
ncbi:hypothetical protein BDR04DRAFT_1123168 [Suillus decipiens]|nr:hypothetical protein BDR04DRAFT_1123168 [Suillus decipiens]